MLPEESSMPARRAVCSLLLTLVLGCGSDERVESRPDSAHGTEKDSGLTVRPDAARAPVPSVDARVVLPIEDPSTAGDGAVSAPAEPSSGDGGAPDAGGRKTCGGIAGIPCRDNEFCSQEDATAGLGCGFPDSTGVCTPRGRACDAVLQPVCGCDTKTYGNECEAHVAGVSIAKRGECPTGQSVSCDGRTVTCKRTRPTCVGIEQCVCKEADACPERETYVCHMSAGHCGPYVN
jgi:hypothetical protein